MSAIEKYSGEWESSDRKRSRLIRELKEIHQKVITVFEVAKKDIAVIGEFRKKLESLEAQIDVLEKQEMELKDKYDQVEPEPNITTNQKVDQYEKLFDVRMKLMEFYAEIDSLFMDIRGIEGDSSTSQSIVNSEIQKAEAIKQQLKELDSWRSS